MKKGYSWIIVFFVSLIIVYTARVFIDDKITTKTLMTGSIENSVTTKAIIIKNEALYTKPYGNIVENNVKEGEKVSKGAKAATVYSGEVDPAVKNRLDQVIKKISVAESNKSSVISFSNDLSKLESEISARINDVIDAGYAQNMSEVSSLKHKLSALVDKKAIVGGQKDENYDVLNSLYDEKAELERQLGAVSTPLWTDNSGIFSTYIDGMEEVITPQNMKELLPSGVDELVAADEKKENTQSQYLFKIIDNFDYYIAVNMSSDDVYGMETGQKVKLRFNELANTAVDTSVYSISADENGRNTVIFEGNRYLDGLLDKRCVSVDVIKNQYQGYKIPINAIKTVDNVKGIFVDRENVMRFIPVEILFSGEETAIVKEADAEKPLKLYDGVIIKASKYIDGKMLK